MMRRFVEANLASRQVARVIYGAVAFGIGFPAVFFVLSAAEAMTVATAFTLANWSGLGLTSFYGLAASRLAGEGLLAAVLYAAAIGVVGAFLIALKALVH